MRRLIILLLASYAFGAVVDHHAVVIMDSQRDGNIIRMSIKDDPRLDGRKWHYELSCKVTDADCRMLSPGIGSMILYRQGATVTASVCHTDCGKFIVDRMH